MVWQRCIVAADWGKHLSGLKRVAWGEPLEVASLKRLKDCIAADEVTNSASVAHHQKVMIPSIPAVGRAEISIIWLGH